MKKIFLTLGALLTFCIASAQTDTISTQTPEQTRKMEKKNKMTPDRDKSQNNKTKVRKSNTTMDTTSTPTTSKKRKGNTTPPVATPPQKK